jgi:hypothetical protein
LGGWCGSSCNSNSDLVSKTERDAMGGEASGAVKYPTGTGGEALQGDRQSNTSRRNSIREEEEHQAAAVHRNNRGEAGEEGGDASRRSIVSSLLSLAMAVGIKPVLARSFPSLAFWP